MSLCVKSADGSTSAARGGCARLWEPLPGETVELLDRIGEEDRLRARQGLVAVVGADGRASYRHIDALGGDDMEDRLAAEWLEEGWLKQRTGRRRKDAYALPMPAHLG
jgi:hypothetical protein